MKKVIIGVLAALTLSGASVQAFSADSTETGKTHWETVTTDYGKLSDVTPEKLCDKILVAVNANTYSGHEYGPSYKILDYYYSEPSWKYGDGYLTCYFYLSSGGPWGVPVDIQRVSTH